MHVHDHATSTHAMKCLEEGCSFEIRIHAHSDEEAVLIIMANVQAHYQQQHADSTPPAPVELLNLIRHHLIPLI